MRDALILVGGMAAIFLATVVFGGFLAWYLKNREAQTLREIKKITEHKGIAVGKLAQDLGRSTLSR